MAWTNPTTQSTGTLITATIWNTDIVDNLTALRSGSVALTSQATGDVIYASSSTQLGRVAIGSSGYVLTSNGSAPTWSNTPTLTGTNFTGIPAASILAGTFGSGNYTIPGLLTVSGFGTHSFSAGGTGGNNIAITNTTSGTGNQASVTLTAGTNVGAVLALSQGYTTSGPLVASATLLYSEGAGGISVSASGANGDVRLYNRGGTLALTLGASQAASFTGDLSLAATKKLYLDGGSDTYIVESSANVLSTYTGGVNSFGVNSDGPFVIAGKKLFLDGGGDTYIQENSGNQLTVVAGGAEGINITSAGIWKTTWSTTASAANAFVGDGNYLLRSTSSIRYKHDIDTLDADHALSAVMAMRPVTYRGKTDEDQRRHVGFIAEEVAEIAPLLATYDEGGETGTPNYVTYDRVTAYLVAVVQQQQAEINALKAQMKEKQ